MNPHKRKKLAALAAQAEAAEKARKEQEQAAKKEQQLPLGLKKLEEVVVEEKVELETPQVPEEKIEQVVADIVVESDKISSKKKKSFK